MKETRSPEALDLGQPDSIDDESGLLEALEEFESSLGCSILDYISNKEAQENANIQLNERNEVNEK
jgi:hypothetical protein